MRKSLVILLAGLACVMLLAAGCTTSSGTPPATPAATPAATTATAMPSAPVNETTTAAPAPLWSGSWNSSYSMAGSADVIELLVLNQTGSSVTGFYGPGKNPIAGTVKEGTITGTWNETDVSGAYSGFFVFERSADGNSFAGKWVYTSEGADTLRNTTQYWNGVRI